MTRLIEILLPILLVSGPLVTSPGCASDKRDGPLLLVEKAPSVATAEHVAKASAADAEFEAAAKRPANARTLYATAKLLKARGREGECQAVLLSVLKQQPLFMPAYCDLAEMRLRQRQIDQAIGILEAGLKLKGHEPVLLNNLGMCHMLKGEYHAALDCFTAATSVRPANARYRGNMAAALGMLGRYEESLALYKQVLPSSEAEHNLTILVQARRRTVPLDPAATQLLNGYTAAPAGQDTTTRETSVLTELAQPAAGARATTLPAEAKSPRIAPSAVKTNTAQSVFTE